MILITQAFSAIATLATFALIGHVLGQAALGEYALGLALASPVFILCGLSARTTYVTLPSAMPPWRAARIGLGGVAVAALVTQLLGFTFGIPTIAALVAGVKGIDHFMAVCQGILQRRGHIGRAYVGQLINAILTVAVVAVALVLTESLELALTMSLLASCFVVGIGGVLVRVSPGAEPVAPDYGVAEFVRAGLPLSLAASIVALSIAVPTYAVAAWAGAASVAIYSVLSSVRTAANVFFNAIAQSELHQLARASREQDHGEFDARIRGAFRLVAVSTVVVAACLLTAGPAAIAVAFNVDAEGLRGQLAVVCLGIAAAGFTFVADAGLSSVQAYTSQLRAALVALGFVVLASVTLVPVAGVTGGLCALVVGLTASAVMRGVQLRTRLAKRTVTA
jgi:O-antigen/teichoic acid export membrane protein